MRDKYTVIDLETTIKNTIGKNKASPFNPENYVVMAGFIEQGKTPFIWNAGPFNGANFNYSVPTMYIGQNIKFDIHHLRVAKKTFNGKSWREWVASGGHIWDTQLAEYLLTAQQSTFASLDTLAIKYGGTLKNDEVKACWEAGIQTEDIDGDMLKEYLIEDVKNTELVAMQQMQQVYDNQMLPLIRTQMDALLAVEEMEFNGMALDTKLLSKLTAEHTTKLASVERDLLHYMHSLIPLAPFKELNIGSAKQLATVLFGGTFTYKEKQLVGKYKNGKDKFKIMDVNVPVNGLYYPKKEWETKTGISVSESVLKNLIDEQGPTVFLEKLLEYRKLAKELSTYLIGLRELMFPDGFIHHNLNQVLTRTGRLSSSDPNLQNIPSNEESRIKELFVSRWGEDGVIIEADYKQLEVIALAFLSGDTQLIDDIVHGRDLHFETGKTVFGWKDPSDMTKDTRRIVKTVNFALIYGAGAAAAASNAGVEKELAQRCIDSFYYRYPEVRNWQGLFSWEVEHKKVPAMAKTEKGYPAAISVIESLTGRRYAFTQYDAPEWMFQRDGTTATFSPTEMKNYPVQGFATGDIVPMVMGKMLRALYNSPYVDKCLMINQVHDALLFDCHKSILSEASSFIKEIMEDAPRMLNEEFDIDFTLPLKVEISAGPNWKKQEEIA